MLFPRCMGQVLSGVERERVNMATKVGFVLTRMQKTPVGGYKVVYQYANYLAVCGYDVTIYYESSDVGESFTRLPRMAKRMVAKQWVKEGPMWFPLSKSVKQKAIFGIDDKQIDDGDAIVATAVRTAQGVASLSSTKGCKLYLIQDYEVWGDYSEEAVKATYALGMTNMVISEWLGDIVREACGTQPILMPDGIDHSIFCPDDAIAREEHTVALLYSENPWKGCKDAIAALRLAKQQIPDLRVELFGGPARPEGLPEWFAYTQNASQEQLHVIYNRSSVVLCASVDEGFGLTGLEGMSCGCALVSTAYPGVYVYADESCALLSKQQDPEALAENLVRMLTDDELRARYSSAALERASEYDLEKSCEKFKRVVDGKEV